jgi:superfamily I DNA and/or RNA helicase
LAVLSPYWQQVKRLGKAITQHREGRLKSLSSFSSAIESPDYCGTVDSFQGGEADAVVISLVRNNHHSTPARALGFLRDNRRMNVLLSRAKWRLVVIGSLSFYRHIVATAETLQDQDIGFLSTFLQSLDEEVADGSATIVSWSSIAGVKP